MPRDKIIFAFAHLLSYLMWMLESPPLKAGDELIRRADLGHQRPDRKLAGRFRHNNFFAFGIGIRELDGNTAADIAARQQGIEYVGIIDFRKMLQGHPGFVIGISVNFSGIKMKIGVMDHWSAGLDTLNQMLGFGVKAFTGRNKDGHCHLVQLQNYFYIYNK